MVTSSNIMVVGYRLRITGSRLWIAVQGAWLQLKYNELLRSELVNVID